MKFILIILFLLSNISFAGESEFSSSYTNLAKCQKTGRCAGEGGYSVFFESGDVRSWLGLKSAKGELDLQGVGEGDLYFPYVKNFKNSQLEWRWRTSDGKRALIALIYRVYGADRKAYESGNANKETSFLYVVKLDSDSPCVLGKASSNTEARALADSQPPVCGRDGNRCIKCSK